MTENMPLAGRPINGDISHYGSNSTEQEPIDKFLNALDALFAFPEVQAIRWHQYTPYFNDGEACEFGIYEAYVKFVGDDDSGDHGDGFRDTGGEYPPGYFDTHEHKQTSYNSYTRQYEPSPHNDPTKADSRYGDTEYYVADVVRSDIKTAHQAFCDAVGSGAHYVDLRTYFGDPAEVTATREGFDVEFYEHD